MDSCHETYETEEDCGETASPEHYCGHAPEHAGAHECPCGIDWL